MDCYIRTRGDALDHGYRWVSLGATVEPSSEPSFIQSEAYRLVYGEEFSLLIASHKNGLALSVTGLLVTNRSGRLRPNVRNILICEASWPEESIVRGIAIASLNGKLNEIVDTNILASPIAPGFTVNTRLYQEIAALRASEGQPIRTASSEIYPSDEESRKWLIDQLRQWRLSQAVSIHVVVTKYQSTEKLRRTLVWRGLVLDNDSSASRSVAPLQIKFPAIQAVNWQMQHFRFPKSFAGDLNIIAIASDISQAQELHWEEKAYQHQSLRKLPVYVILYTRPLKVVLNFDFFRAAIPQLASLQEALYWLDPQSSVSQKPLLFGSLGLSDTTSLYLAVVTREGEVLWQAPDAYEDTCIQELATFIEQWQRRE